MPDARPRRVSGPCTEKSQWVDVLHLAHLWGLTKLKESAIAELDKDKLGSIEKLDLGRRYDVSKWLVPLIVRLALREKTISREEAEQLGFEFSFKLVIVREAVSRIKDQGILKKTLKESIESSFGVNLGPLEKATDIHDAFPKPKELAVSASTSTYH